MIDAGVGETQVSSIMTAIGMPTATPKCLKKYERIVGEAIEAEAQESCRRSLIVEKKLTIEANDVITDK